VLNTLIVKKDKMRLISTSNSSFVVGGAKLFCPWAQGVSIHRCSNFQ